jgi:hypothetical protein
MRISCAYADMISYAFISARISPETEFHYLYTKPMRLKSIPRFTVA